MKVIQFLIALAVVMGCIWFQETHDYKINPWLMGIFAVAAPYAFTVVYVWLSDLRRLQKDR